MCSRKARRVDTTSEGGCGNGQSSQNRQPFWSTLVPSRRQKHGQIQGMLLACNYTNASRSLHRLLSLITSSATLYYRVAVKPSELLGDLPSKIYRKMSDGLFITGSGLYKAWRG